VKLLLDENVPAPMTSTVKILLRRSHDVQHVIVAMGCVTQRAIHRSSGPDRLTERPEGKTGAHGRGRALGSPHFSVGP
jgi:hypothetical protein